MRGETWVLIIAAFGCVLGCCTHQVVRQLFTQRRQPEVAQLAPLQPFHKGKRTRSQYWTRHMRSSPLSAAWTMSSGLAGLRQSAGDLRLLREVLLVPPHAWDATAAGARVPFPSSEDDGPAPDSADRALTAPELGQIASFRRIARRRVGVPAEEAGTWAGRSAAAATMAAAGGGNFTSG